MTRSLRSVAFDLTICLLATLAWASRVLPHLATHLRDGYDAELQAWGVAWGSHALSHAPLRAFDANLFSPFRNSLAFTEPLLGYGLAGIPLTLIGADAVLVFNLLCIAGTAFSLWAVSRLAIAHGASRPAALFGACAAGLGAAAASNLGYLPFVVCGAIALPLVAWKRLRETGMWGASLGLGLSLGALAWFSLQIFAFALAALVTTLGVDVLVRREMRRIDLAGRLGAAMLLATVVVAPLAVHMLDARRAHGFARDDAESRQYSAAWGDWITTSNANPGQAFLTRRSDSERSLYPGSATLLLSAVALVAVLDRTRRAGLGGLVSAGVLLAVLGIGGSFGPAGPVVPVLRIAIPFVFSGIRAFSRFAFVAQVGFGLLAAAGCSALLDFARKKGARAAVGFVLALGIACDVRQTVAFEFRPESRAAGPRTLAVAHGLSVLHLPMFAGPGDARWAFASIGDFPSLVNGYASYIPRKTLDLATTLAAEHIPPETLDALRAWPVERLVVHEHALPLDRLSSTMIFLSDCLRSGTISAPRHFAHGGGDDWVFDLPRGSRRVETEPAETTRFLAHAATIPAIGRFEQSEFAAAIDGPPEGALVRGALTVRGWAQTSQGPAGIVEIRFDRDVRVAANLVREARPDVAAALPALGNCDSAGYSAAFPFLPGDDARHDIRIVFRAPDGGLRTLVRSFRWLP